MDRQKVHNFLTNNLDEFAVGPESQFVEVPVKDVNTDVDGIAGLDIGEFDAKVTDDDGMIVVHEALATQGEDVAETQKRLRDAQGTE